MKEKYLFLRTFSIIIIILLIIYDGLLKAQNVGISTTGAVPNSSALLDVDASPGNNLGMLIPRVALTQTTSNAPIGAGAAVSLLVYNTATINDVTPGFYYWTGAVWNRFFTGTGGYWQLTGNAGTVAGTNFIGTTDAIDWVVKTNNAERMRILSSGNVGIGTAAPLQKLDVNGNINLSSTMNIRINDVRVFSNAGSYNLFAGDNAGISNLAAGQYNSFFGYEAGSRNTTGMYNTFIGFRAGNASVGSFENVVIGDRAGGWGTSLGDFNVLVGAQAGLQSTATQNTFIGGQAGGASTTGGYNVFVGALAGDANTTGTYNTIIGNSADVGSTGLTKSGAIGYNAIVNANNAFVIGGTGIDAVNVGIGTTIPNSSSLLDLTSTNRGMLVPRMTALQKTAIALPATGLLIYQTDAPAGFYYYTGSVWTNLFSGTTGGWSLTGNAGTVPGTNFIGTTDAVDWIVRTNNTDRLRISSIGNVGIGTAAPSRKLHIYGTSNNAADVYSQTDAGRIIKHWFVNTVVSWSIGQFGTTVAPNGQFRITNETSASPRIVLFTAGNILFNNTAVTNASDLFESFGSGAFPNAIAGYSSVVGGYGVYGQNTAGGSSSSIYGTINSATGFAIQAYNSNASGTGIIASGNGIAPTYLVGGSGGAFSGTGVGLLGYTATNTGRGIYGLNNAPAGSAIGYAGVFASLQTGGAALVGSLGTNFSYYAGSAVSGYTVNTLAGGKGGLFGCDNATGIGVQGQSEGSTGIGVLGISTSATGFGTQGSNNNASGTGIIGVGNGIAGNYLVSGSGGAFTGSSVGIYGYVPVNADNNWAGYFASAATTFTYIAGRSAGTDYAILSTGTKSTIVKDLNNKPVVMFCTETPEVLFQDYGTGKLINGKASITIDPVFSNNIFSDENHPVKVFIQLEGDCQGVYVTNKTIYGFDVIELNNGTSNADFTWTLIANRANTTTDGIISNYSTLRFPDAPKPMDNKTIPKVNFKNINQNNEKIIPISNNTAIN